MSLLAELAQEVPVGLLESLLAEVRARRAEAFTGEVALVVHLRRGYPLTWEARKAEVKRVLALT